MKCILIGQEEDILNVSLHGVKNYYEVIHNKKVLFCIHAQKFHRYGKLGLFIHGERGMWFQTMQDRDKFLKRYQWIYNPLQGCRV
jgi:hypothetical protein